MSGASDIAPPLLENCDRNKLESALAVPFTSHGIFEKYPSFEEKAAALAYSASKAHACIEGNKRVALILMIGFLYINGRQLSRSQPEIAEMVLRASESAPSERDATLAWLTEWFRESMMPL